MNGDIKVCTIEYDRAHTNSEMPLKVLGVQGKDYIGVASSLLSDPTASAMTLIHEMTHQFLDTEDFYDLMAKEETLTDCGHIRAFVDKHKELCWKYSYSYESFLKEFLPIAESSPWTNKDPPPAPQAPPPPHNRQILGGPINKPWGCFPGCENQH